ncbi:hypothetical protein [Mucilaginibacter myungsuensis]|uniref:Uncharacterized protein n=1 Tax=Mucilaginibacter myungsuensis TaxID=649104 RepID=A0A929L025_9SPHI|nr:hypothetical protein [Mucilaginibacter myungsuensis]MBE9663628.1 hypothetical protein [Mucilaginibacter myungsuensis]MDN3599048.1 hypothetical protein [Mucilaginibacter myungsuensis]
MKWLFRIFLSLNIFLLCGSGLTGAHPLGGADTSSIISHKVHVDQHFASSNADLKFNPVTESDGRSKLSVAELEDEDAESTTGKKQLSKTSPADIFLNAWNLACGINVVHNNLHHGKLPVALALNKIYLSLQVFRL